MPTTWMIRCDGGRLFRQFQAKSVVALGYDDLDFTPCATRDDVSRRILESLANRRDSQAIGELAAFRLHVAIGDHVLTYDPASRWYLIGEVTGDYRYTPDLLDGVHQSRRVNWLGSISRDQLSHATRLALGGQHTIFKISAPAAEEILDTTRAAAA